MLLFLVLTLRWANSDTAGSPAVSTAGKPREVRPSKRGKGSSRGKGNKERVDSDDQQSASSSGKEEKMDTAAKKTDGNAQKRKKTART